MRARPIGNVDASPVSYTLDPAGHVRALYDAEAAGRHLSAVFHSHPQGPPVPSPSDVAGALEPEWAHVIVGLGGEAPEVRAFRIDRGAVTEEAVVVVERV
jgi:proteasome lid subunit RPN8/RPN11